MLNEQFNQEKEKNQELLVKIRELQKSIEVYQENNENDIILLNETIKSEQLKNTESLEIIKSLKYR